MVYVIGSGPAGVAAAYALVTQGFDVTMFDVGVELEPDRQGLVDELYAGKPDTWNPDQIAKLKEGMLTSVGGIPQKRTYGSDYPFRDVGQAAPVEVRDAEVLLSGARGGLSTVWGSNLMPYTARDIQGWCVTAADLAPHYAAVTAFVPVSASRDDLEEFFPLYGSGASILRPSRQAAGLMQTLRRHKDELRANGMVAGFGRLAVQVNPTPANARGCVYCGLCLYGCPYRLIYSSAYSLRDLERHGNFRYVPGVVVDKLVERPAGVDILARAVADGAPMKYEGRRVYLACGVMATTRILLESLQAYNTRVVVKDSQYFLLPMLHYDGVPGVMDEALHTLGQVYVEVFDEALSKNTIQLQFYTYNDFYVSAMRARLGFLHPLVARLLPAVYGRLSILQGYLHSNDSRSLVLSLEPGGDRATLHIQSLPSDQTVRVIEGVMRKLWRHRSLFRAIPVKPMLQVFPPGKSYHYGGTFPMMKNPAGFESDVWGRPAGWRRVHAVDATVLPGIAATSIVFTAMANAHRIASACRELEQEPATRTAA